MSPRAREPENDKNPVEVRGPREAEPADEEPRRRAGTVSRPLSVEERRQIESVLVRLSAQVQASLRAAGLGEAGPAQVSRALGLDRATSHRLLEVARDGSGTLELVGRAPGPQALESFARAAERAGVPPEIISSLRGGAEAFEATIRDLGRSKASLLARIRLGDEEAGAPEDDDLARRRAIFQNTAALRGAWSRGRVDLTIMRSGPEEGGAEALMTRGFAGVVSRPGAMPLRMDFMSRDSDAEGKDFFFETLPGGGVSAGGLVREFSSDPPPLTVMSNEASVSAFVVDPQRSSRESVDVVLSRYAREMSHPRLDDPPDVVTISLIQFPVRTLVHDLWLSRDMAALTVPRSQAYFTIPRDPMALEHNWMDRMPGAPSVTLLGQGLSGCASRSYARQRELTVAMFERVGWDPREFVGYRFEVEYPLYGGMYLFYCDFRPFSG